MRAEQTEDQKVAIDIGLAIGDAQEKQRKSTFLEVASLAPKNTQLVP